MEPVILRTLAWVERSGGSAASARKAWEKHDAMIAELKKLPRSAPSGEVRAMRSKLEQLVLSIRSLRPQSADPEVALEVRRMVERRGALMRTIAQAESVGEQLRTEVEAIGAKAVKLREKAEGETRAAVEATRRKLAAEVVVLMTSDPVYLAFPEEAPADVVRLALTAQEVEGLMLEPCEEFFGLMPSEIASAARTRFAARG